MELDNEATQPSRCRTKNWVEMNDASCGTYNANSQIKFKTTILQSSLEDYSNANLLVKGTITITQAVDNAAAKKANEKSKGIMFKKCASLTNCISEINNAQVDNANVFDVVMPMCNLIEYSNNYSKISGSLWQY